MWTLELLGAGEEVKSTIPVVDGVYTFGRKGTYISFENDRSVSRRHAELGVGPKSASDPFHRPVWIKDVGSKLRTFVNGVDTGGKDVEVALKDEDLVKLGTGSSTVRLRFHTLRVCATQLTKEDKIALKGLIATIGGTLTNKWDLRCTHLVSPAQFAFVTEKLVLAVAQGRPPIHVGWLEAVIAGAKAKPMRPIPDVGDFGPLCTGRKAQFRVRTVPERRSHLSQEFFLVLHRDENFEAIAEATGGAVCRAYAMADGDFARQDWTQWAAGRRTHFTKPLPGDAMPPDVSRAVLARGAALEELGLEAITKRQLAEAVLWLEPLLSLKEAMQQDSSGTVSAAGLALSETWGPSQSVSSQIQHTHTRAPLAAPSSASTTSNMLPPPVAPTRPSKTPRANEKAAAITTMATVPANIASHGCGQEDGPSSGPAAEAARNKSVKRRREPGAAEEQDRSKGKAARRRGEGEGQGVCNSSGGVTATKIGEGGEEQEAGAHGEEQHGVGAAEDGGSGRERASRDGWAISSEPRRGGRIGSNGRTGEDEKRAARHQQQQQQQQQERGKTYSPRAGQKRKLSGSTSPSSGHRDTTTPPPLSPLAVAGRGDGSTPPSTTGGNGSVDSLRRQAERQPLRRILPASEGWMSTRDVSSRKRAGGGGKRGAGGDSSGIGTEQQQLDQEEAVKAIEEEAKADEDETPLESAETESRRLVVRAFSRNTGRGNRSSASPSGQGECPAPPNFKRFKKNTVLFGGEGLGTYVPTATLRVTIPKESERELLLAAEQRQLEEEEADAERLFTQEIRGGGRRAPQGRVRRR